MLSPTRKICYFCSGFSSSNISHLAQDYCEGNKKHGGVYGDHHMKHRKDITRLIMSSFFVCLFFTKDLVKFVSKESLQNNNKKIVETVTRETK